MVIRKIWHLDNFLGIVLGSDNRVKVFSYLDNSTGTLPNSAYMSSSATLSLNNWHHIALLRHNNIFYLFINGKLDSQKQSNANLTSTDIQPIVIGGYTHEDILTVKKAYFDEFRISNVARWTSDFDPNPKVGEVGKALLVVTMSDEIQKEYDLSMDEINDFISWYDNRSVGTGLPHYTFNKDFNLGPFQSRKDYLVFDKIQNFEVMEYTK